MAYADAGVPVGHDLGEAFGLEVHVDVRNDLSTAGHTLQTVGLQDAMQLWHQEEHGIDKAECTHTHTQYLDQT